MTFEASVYRILVASPGDVEDERNVVSEVIDRWNALNAASQHIVLLPVKWESHSYSSVGDRPQAFINEQVLRQCDLLIGVFWTRLGSPTGVSESGTVEEIETFIKDRKPVMLYFSSAQVDPRKIDFDQFKAVRDFEEKMRRIGLVGSYENLTDFKERLFDQLSNHVTNMKEGKSAKPMSEREYEKKQAAVLLMIKEGTVHMEDYEKNGKVRSFIVKGDTKKYKDRLKELGGRWNPALGGWTFPKTKELAVAEVLKAR